jgi:hypothetical protein
MSARPMILTVLTPYLPQIYKILNKLNVGPISCLGRTEGSTYLKLDMNDRQLAALQRLDIPYVECIHQHIFT